MVNPGEPLKGRLVAPAVALLGVVALGVVGYHQLGGGRWSLDDCLYMTVITLTTVGYGEVLPGMDAVPMAREFTALLIVAGMGVFLYFASHVTAIIIEGDLQRALRKTRMRSKIAKLVDHVVVCGAGSTGRHVVEELLAAARPVVAVDVDEESLEEQGRRSDRALYHSIHGDATDDVVLRAANVTAAAGVVAALPNDKDNLYLVVTARQANARARIVARGSDLAVLEKLRKAGADAVVSPNFIGGMRMVSELLRPQVVRFLDDMLRDREGRWRIEEVALGDSAPLVGQSLREVNLRGRYEITVLAVRGSDGAIDYAPDADLRLEGGSTLVVLGRLDQVRALRGRAESRR